MTADAPKLLWIGCGALAEQTLPLITHYQITGLSRRPKSFLAPYDFVQADLAEQNLSGLLGQQPFAAIVITLTPKAYSAEDYRTTYWLNSQYIVQQLPALSKPLLLFVSSTSVYHQTDGQWVDEHSPTAPTSASAQWLLNAEQVIAQSNKPFCIVRPAGIYGPRRDFLIRQVQQGIGGGEQFTNRIHSVDLSRLLAFLLDRYRLGGQLPPYLLATDDTPVTSRAIRAWIAKEKLGLDPATLQPPVEPTRGGNKRISNHLMRSLGFTLHYPSFLEGYSES